MNENKWGPAAARPHSQSGIALCDLEPVSQFACVLVSIHSKMGKGSTTLLSDMVRSSRTCLDLWLLHGKPGQGPMATELSGEGYRALQTGKARLTLF